MSNLELKVSGMNCMHCVKRVEKALLELPGIKEVKVDLQTGMVSLDKPDDLSLDEIKAAIKEAGYQVES
ncbi:heavy-metal-associated domain-containing protein [Thermodesulfatator autotrophicus]|uniref:HMA domain-containing protein n=1 Tax=Thermodesulfatator autotrophicus TaxID=1795632 RepID=A0A177E9C5_9BACT|nr:copper ion binding protein [Thermodesulfatator autotrophicus]OAG28515.1 hypothetical protein TH606_01410 [Thermodesulfatator autotrophicus]